MMHLLRNWINAWRRLRDIARREFLRDPNVILFDRAATAGESCALRSPDVDP